MSVICLLCDKMFATQSTLNRHKRETHHLGINASAYEFDKYNAKCYECASSFLFVSTLREHLDKLHNFKSETIYLNFNNMQDFKEWFENISAEQSVEYIRKRGPEKRSETSQTITYDCNRSIVGRGKQESTVVNRRRNKKSHGSKKIDGSCTSQIKLKLKKNGRVSVTYHKTHYNHDFDIQHVRISKSEREKIAEKLLAGLSTSEILQQYRDDITGNEVRRINLITRKDINNVKHAYGIVTQEGERNKHDAISIEMWVQEQNNNENCSVLYYKKPGEESDILKEKDFCLVVMNKSQKYMLEKFGENIICIDSTYGLRKYDFDLTTVIVIDEYGEGFPVAYMLSNRKDAYINEVFFSVIKDKIGFPVITKTFIGDTTELFFSTWCSVMGHPEFQLYSPWYIDKTWQKDIMKIKNIDKRKLVYKNLKFLQNSATIEEFDSSLQNSIKMYYEDPDVIEFGIYFQQQYGHNYALWASCFQQSCGVNTNILVESLHKTVKYYLNLTKVHELDKRLYSLLNYTRDRVIDRILKNAIGKDTVHIKKILARHRIALTDTLTLHSIDADNYQVLNNNHQDCYKITKTSDGVCCQLVCEFCNICVHTFKCTCNDFIVHNTICKHIHYTVINTTASCDNLSDQTSSEPLVLCAEFEIQTDVNSSGENGDDEIELQLKQNIENKISSILHKLNNNIYDKTILEECCTSIEKLENLLDTNNVEPIVIELKSDPP